jgi:hypothetical protein
MARAKNFAPASIDFIIEEQDLHTDVAAKCVQEMIAAYRQTIAIARYDPDIEVRIGQLEARCDRGCPAVDSVETIAIDVVREASGAADA